MSIVAEETATSEETITEKLDETQPSEEIQAESQEGNVEEIAEGNQDDGYEIPDKYAGKSLRDVIEMHQNVEQVYSRHSEEVGKYRELIKQMLDNQSQPSTTGQTEEEQITLEDNFYDDPVKAVNSAIENHPDVLRAKEERAFQEQQRKIGVLDSAYPDWKELVNNDDFKKWVGASEIRIEMFNKADSEYKPEYAIELFDTYSKVNMIDKTKEVQKNETAKRDKALRKTISETRSTNSVGGKKNYRRADLINLQVTDPSRYEALSDEIQQAYAEGRVR